MALTAQLRPKQPERESLSETVKNTRQFYVEFCQRIVIIWGGIHEWGITYDGFIISRSDITELELGPSENSYSGARQMSVIIVLEVSGCQTGCLVTKRCTAYGRRVLFVQLENQMGSDNA